MTELNNSIPVEEKPLSLKSKIEYLNGLAIKNQTPEYLIPCEEENKILNNQAIVEKIKEFHKQYELVMVGLDLPDKSAQLVIQGTYSESFRKLKEILETTKHSDCKGDKK